MGAIHESSRAAIPYPHNVTSAICIPDGQNKERQKMYTGIDIGGTKCAVVLSDDNGNILKKERFPTVGFEETLAKIIDTTERVGIGKAIGISCGGPLDSERGVIMSPPNLPGWDDVHIADILGQRFGVPVGLCNDADACALAEWKFGAGKGTKNMIFMTFGTGLGAGLILNGKLYSGSSSSAGEAGHIRLAPDGPTGYRKAGSFEGFCSGGGIRQIGQQVALREIKRGNPPAWCRSEEELDTVTAKTVGDAAEAGDTVATEVYDISGEKLGYGLSILIDLLNPEKIVLGGIYMRSAELLNRKMYEVLEREALPQALSVCRIVPAGLGESIGDLAAVLVAMQAAGAL